MNKSTEPPRRLGRVAKPPGPVQQPDEKKNKRQREYAWHRHPAFVAAIPAVAAVAGSVLTIGLGQANLLPSSINPAPPPATILATQTVTATSTVTETVSAPTTETTPPTGTSSPPVTAAPGGLAITIVMSTSGKIGPGEYRAGATVNAVAHVLDESGHYPGTGCYPTWVLKRGSAVVKTGRSGSCRDTFYFSSDSLDVRGAYYLTVSAVTEGGAEGTATLDFKVT